jgi:hypothetical protein
MVMMRFNAGFDNIATKKSLRPTTYAPAPSTYVQNTSPVTYRVHLVTNQVHPASAHTTATLPHAHVPPAPATLPHALVPPQVHPAYAHAHPQPLLYQKSSPNVIQESHPHDVRPSRPRTTTNQDYDEALQ